MSGFTATVDFVIIVAPTADLARFAYSYNAVGSITQIAEPVATDRNFG